MKLQTFDSSFFIDQSYFINDASQKFLIFQPTFKTFEMPVGLTDIIVEWESKGLLDRKI